MSRLHRPLLVPGLLVGLMIGFSAISATVASAQERAGKKTRADPFEEFFAPPKEVRSSLTAEQIDQLAALKNDLGPRARSIAARIDAVVTPERSQAQAAAFKAGKAAGKSAGELKAAVDAAAPLSPEEERNLKAARAEMEELRQQVQQRIVAVLTPDQRARLPRKKGEQAPADPVAQHLTLPKEWQTVLSPEQVAQVENLRSESRPGLTGAQARIDAILTVERRQAQTEATRAATTAGKERAEVFAAGSAALALTEQEQDDLATARSEIVELQEAFRERVRGLLTEGQRAVVESAPREKPRTKGERAEAPPPNSIESYFVAPRAVQPLLSDAQRAQLEQLKAELAPRVEAELARINLILPPSRQTEQTKAVEAARAAGKGKAEAAAAGAAALNLSPREQEDLATAQRALAELRETISIRITNLLTEPQRALLAVPGKTKR